jgi:nucleotide-binding universal stress UspA family protein
MANPAVPSVAIVYCGDCAPSDPMRICVPLDGSAHAETALPYVVRLAEVLPVELDLLHVRATGGEGTAHDYLALVAGSIAEHVVVTRCTVTAGRPADVVLEHLETRDICSCSPHMVVLDFAMPWWGA